MKLFLCSTFITSETKSDFETLMGRPMKGLKIACIITATMGYKSVIENRGEVWDLSWIDNDLANEAKTYQCTIDEYDINEMSQTEIRALYKDYDGVWVYGGIAGFLMKSINDKRCREILIDFANEKFYIGTSSGSMISAKSLDACEWYIDEPEEGASKYEGLGLIDFQVYPHYNEQILSKIIQARMPNEYGFLKMDKQLHMMENV